MVVEQDLWTNNLDDGEAFCNEVCKHLGWPEVRDYLEIGAQIENARFEHHREAFRLRLDDFSAFYFSMDETDTGESVDRFLNDYMPLTQYPGIGVVCGFVEHRQDRASPTHQIRDSYMANLEEQAMLGTIEVSELLPNGFTFEQYFENISASIDLGHLLAEKYTWLNLDRFTQ